MWASILLSLFSTSAAPPIRSSRNANELQQQPIDLDGWLLHWKQRAASEPDRNETHLGCWRMHSSHGWCWTKFHFSHNFIVIAFPRPAARRNLLSNGAVWRCAWCILCLLTWFLRRSCPRSVLTPRRKISSNHGGTQWSIGWEKCRFSGADWLNFKGRWPQSPTIKRTIYTFSSARRPRLYVFIASKVGCA